MIEALGQRYGLAAPELDQLRSLVDRVATDAEAPTSVTDRAGILRDHVADSLVALELPEVRGATALADLGAGAGFPGLPLAIALPQSAVSLLESNGRKCAFMQRTAAVCSIANVEVVNARAEEWQAGRRALRRGDRARPGAAGGGGRVRGPASPAWRNADRLARSTRSGGRGGRRPGGGAAGFGAAPANPRGAVRRGRASAPTPDGEGCSDASEISATTGNRAQAAVGRPIWPLTAVAGRAIWGGVAGRPLTADGGSWAAI